MVDSVLYHSEIESLRVVMVPGGITHPVLGILAAKGVFPAPIQFVGTITTIGKNVVGLGTQFHTGGVSKNARFDPGDIIYDPNQNVARRIDKVSNNLQMTLFAAFPVDISTPINVYRIPKTYHKIYAKSTGASAAILLEQKFALLDTFENAGAPVTYDASGAGSEISFSLHL